MKVLRADEVTEAGAYEWVDTKGMRHVGFLLLERRGDLGGPFVSADGASRAVRLKYSDGSPCEGTFYGPLPAAHQAAAVNT